MKQDNISQVARFWNQSAFDFDKIYSGEKSRLGRALDSCFRRDMFQRFRWVLDAAGDVRGQTICDVGCGSGRFVVELAKRGAARITGIDIAPNMLALSHKLAGEEGVQETCNFVQADVLDWNTNEKFDLVIAIGFWDYIADPLPRLHRIRAMTRGKFLSAWPRLWTWRVPLRKARLGLKGCPVYFFSRQRVHRLLKEAGFQVSSCTVVGKLFCVQARPV